MADPIALAGADLRATVLGSRHAAARSVQIVQIYHLVLVNIAGTLRGLG